MPSIEKRGGVTLVRVDGGWNVVMDPGKVTAADQLKPLGQITVLRLTDEEAAHLAKNIGAEAGRFWKRVKGWLSPK